MIEDLLLRLGAEDIRPTPEGFECRCFMRDCRSSRRSFRVAYRGNNGRPGAFFCHKCKRTGDLIGLTMRAFHTTREQAEELAKNSGAWVLAHKKNKPEFVEVTLADIAPYRSTLSSYLVDERGYEEEVVYRYRIGMDSFTGELVIPTYSIDDKIVGITRRVAEDGAPYIHYPFPKSAHVYGLNLAVIKGAKRIYITEGQLDPLGLYPYCEDDEDVVAINGSYVSEDQADLLVGVGSELVLAFDNDYAGFQCTHQGIKQLRESGARKLFVLEYNCSDPGKLPFQSKPEFKIVSSVAWLSQRKNQNHRRKQKRHSNGTQRYKHRA